MASTRSSSAGPRDSLASTRTQAPSRFPLLPPLAALLPATLFVSACSSASPSATPADAAALEASGGDDATADDAGDEAGDDDAPPAQASLRIAALSPDAPAVDVCVAPHGTSAFQGPLLAALAASAFGDGGDGDDGGDGGAAGLAYLQVSVYVTLAPGQYDARVVAAGATSCAAPLATGALDAGTVADATSLPALAAGSFTTLLVAGDLAPAGADAPFALSMVPDDSTLAGGAASLRAINAVPSAASLDFGLGSSAGGWLPLLTGVAFGGASAHAASSDGVVDSAGYLVIAPMSGQVVSARASSVDAGTDGGGAVADTAVAEDVEIDMGSVATLVAVGGKTGDAAHPAALLLCIDNQPSGGFLSDCSVAQ